METSKMTATKLDNIVTALFDWAEHRTDDEEWGLDSCILSTKIALQVLTHFGFDARPVAVHVFITNARFYQALDTGEITLDTPPWNQPDNCYALGLGLIENDPANCQHVVVVVGNTMLDLTLDQASRPQHGIVLGPTAFRIPNAIDHFEDQPYQFEMNDGAILIYYPHAGNRWYANSPNWGRRDAPARAKIAGEIIRAVRREE